MKSKIFKVTTLRLFYVLVIMPQLILLYLSGIPKTNTKKIIYISKWVIVSSFTEYVFYKTRTITFQNGWNLFCSVLIYIKMFILSYLFTFKKCIILLISFIVTSCFVVHFKPPLYRLFLRPLYIFKRIRDFEWNSK